jgi:hypothetical protein
VIPLFDGDEETVKVIGSEPPVTVLVSNESVPADADTDEDDPRVNVIAAVATILKPIEDVADLLSVTVIVSK